MSKSAIAELLEIDWATVGRCISRVKERLEPNPSRRLDGLVNIAINETSYRKRHKYITVVLNQDTCEVVWAADGHGKEVMTAFLGSLTEEQKSSIKTVAGDGARWIDACLKEHLPHAIRCVDPFHVSSWATEMMDEIRRSVQNDLTRRSKAAAKAGDKAEATRLSEEASDMKGSRYAFGKGIENLMEYQQKKFDSIVSVNTEMFIAHTLKERFREILRTQKPDEAAELLDLWVKVAAAAGEKYALKPLVALSEKIQRHTQTILNTITHGMNSARIESINNKIKLIIRRAYGFATPQNLIDMVLLVCGPNPPKLPRLGRKLLELL